MKRERENAGKLVALGVMKRERECREAGSTVGDGGGGKKRRVTGWESWGITGRSEMGSRTPANRVIVCQQLPIAAPLEGR